MTNQLELLALIRRSQSAAYNIFSVWGSSTLKQLSNEITQNVDYFTANETVNLAVENQIIFHKLEQNNCFKLSNC